MLHRCVFQLAKKKAPPQRRHVLRRNLRRSGSGGGTSGSAVRRAGSAVTARSGKDRPSFAALSKGKSKEAKSVSDGVANAAEENPNGASGVAGAAASASTTPGALVSEESSHPPTASVRRPLYRLATAVATVVVPPTTNVYLQSMKHLLTPASSPALANASIGGAVSAATPAVSIVEEYYTSKKGPLFATAVVAGTNAVKQVSSLIPFCYPSPIQRCSFTFRRRQVLRAPRPSQMPHRVVLRRRTSTPSQPPNRPEYSVLYCFCTVATESKAGVEMEALTGATMASVTLYDMLKGLPGAQEDGLSLGEAFVLAKRGGRNDFTKLLMSEPDRPLVENGSRSTAEIPAAPPLKTSTVADGSVSTANGGSADGGVAAPWQDDSAAQRLQPQHADGGDNDNGKDAAPQRVIRRPAAATTAADETEDGDPNSPGDAGVWWRSSKYERRLQELYPRRKYVDGSRVVPTNLTTAEAGGTPSSSSSKKADAAVDTAVVAKDGEAAPSNKSRHLSKASMIREGRPVTSAVSAKAALKAAREATARKEEAVGDEEDDDTAEIVVEQRRPARGQLAKKTGRGVVAVVDEDADDAPEKRAGPEETSAVEEEEVHDAHEDEELSKGNRKGKRAATSSAAVAKSTKSAAKKPSAVTTASQRRHKAAEEAETNDGDEDVEEENPEKTSVEEEEEEEEEVVAPSRKPSHATSSVVAKKHGRSGGAHAVATNSKGSSSNAVRKQRAAVTATATLKKGRVAAAEEEDEAQVVDEDVEAAEAEDEDGAVIDEEPEDDEAGPVARRGKPAKHSGATLTSTKKKGNVMRPVQHSSWDEVTHKAGGDGEHAKVDEDEAADDHLEDEGEEKEVPPPLPPKKVKKTMKRTVPKKR